MEIFVELLGFKGMVGIIGFLFFCFTFYYAHNIFDWIEHQTIGTRTYILEKLELLFIEVAPERITYILLFLSVGMGATTLLICGFLGHWTAGFILSIILSFIGFKIPKPIINFMVAKRIAQYEDQMVDGLTLLSNGIRAGLSVPQALGMVVDELSPPISQEFNYILQQNRIGSPLEECFENLVKRVPTEDNEMFVSSINILRETGGNLAEVFDTIVGVIRERIRLKQKIKSLTANNFFQGVTIFCMPFVILILYYFSDPASVIRMFTHPLGIILFIVAIILDLIGGYFILKVVSI